MRIAQDFSREAIQPAPTKKPLIASKVEGGTDWRLGESRIYKLRMQLEEDNSPVYLLTVEVKQVLKGQNIGNMDSTYTLIPDNLDHCLNAVSVQVFPNKACKLQKQYI
eukprot:3030333-Ditylum_brightwellii.AAC.1